MYENIGKIIIPARFGSKGIKHKNRFLLNFTLNTIPKQLLSRVVVTTDDDVIKMMVAKYNVSIGIHSRSLESAVDTAPINYCINEVLNDYDVEKDKDIFIFSLTYPKRTWKGVLKSYEWYKSNHLKTLICRGEIDPHSHPYLCMKDNEDGTSTQLIDHNLYRRQEYPKCFYINHYVSIFRVSEFSNLNFQLFNDNTGFYPMEKNIDIDTLDDLSQLGQLGSATI